MKIRIRRNCEFPQLNKEMRILFLIKKNGLPEISFILKWLFYLFKVKNKMPAPVQITAEQLLREAKERELELVPPVSEINYSISKCHILCYLKFIA